MREFDAEGHEVTGVAEAPAADAHQLCLVASVLVGAAVAAGALWYLAVWRPRLRRQREAARQAMAGSDGDAAHQDRP